MSGLPSHGACLSSTRGADAETFAEHATTFAGLEVQSLERRLAPQQLQLWSEVLSARPRNLRELFQALAQSNTFRELWSRRHLKAPFILPRYAFIEQIITLDEIASGLVEATAQGEVIQMAIGLLHGPEESINSELPPVRTAAELEQVLNFGTLFLNAASKHWKGLAAVCRAASDAFGFPANINVYATAPGRLLSTPAHNDHHDVLILQVQGEKRWQVFQPPPLCPGGAHPMHRGKGGDVVEELELGEPLVDVRLRPGESLFVPSGFVHLTSTAGSGTCGDASVHLTLGLSVADCGLSYGILRSQVLLEMGREPDDEEGLDEDTFWALQEPLPLGCLAPVQGFEELQQLVAASLVDLVTRLDAPGPGLEDAAARVAGRWVQIHKDLVEIYDRGYRDVIEAAGEGPIALGLAEKHAGSVFHARRQRAEEGTQAAAALDPALEEATRSITEFCRFLRMHVPQAEVKWRPPQKRSNVKFEVVD